MDNPYHNIIKKKKNFQQSKMKKVKPYVRIYEH